MQAELYPNGSGTTDQLALAEEYRAALGRHALENMIRSRVRDSEWIPGDLHAELLRLPWADVLTTNWDTLLERTAASDADLSFDVVRVCSDIARTRSPRIVKLHGSLPSQGPLFSPRRIFALNGVRVVADGKAEPLRKGSISMRFFPPEVLEAVKPRFDQVPLIVPPLLCAGAEYPAIVAGDRDFAVFWRTLPWDHLPGALFLSEAGGHVARWNGSPYGAGQDGYVLLAARTPDHWRAAHKALFEVMTI